MTKLKRSTSLLTCFPQNRVCFSSLIVQPIAKRGTANLKPCGKLSQLSCLHRAGDDCGKLHTFCLQEIAELLPKKWKHIVEKRNYYPTDYNWYLKNTLEIRKRRKADIWEYNFLPIFWKIRLSSSGSLLSVVRIFYRWLDPLLGSGF